MGRDDRAEPGWAVRRREAGLHAELTDLFEVQNRAGPDRTEIPATYMRVVVDKA